jgi:hypothetical protein
MDMGDWLEYSRLRGENHSWHRCVNEILDALDAPSATIDSIRLAVSHSVDTLNGALGRLRRRPVPIQR